MTAFIELNRTSFMVEPICRTLEIAPSSYYAARSRPLSARAIADEKLKPKISEIHAENFAVYGARKVWHALARKGDHVGRDRVARLMGTLGLVGATRERSIRTTKPADQSARPADLVERNFAAAAPNRLWVADITYVWTTAGFCYTAFIVDVFSRRIVGWRTAVSLRTDLALDALEMAIFARGNDLLGLIHHSDRGVQYASDGYYNLLSGRGMVPSMSRAGNPWDNAACESFMKTLKAEEVNGKAYASLEELQADLAAFLDEYYNRCRLHSSLNYCAPEKFERLHEAAAPSAAVMEF